MGWVYAFVNASMQGIVKIGATKREVSERLKEANASDTWRPPRAYVIACTAEVADPFATERAIHSILASRRVDPKREFFEITADEARGLFALLAPAPRANDESQTNDHVRVVVSSRTKEQPTSIDSDAMDYARGRIIAKVDGAYAEFRSAQDALDATPTPYADLMALLKEMADPDANETAFCCYAPGPYPNGKATCIEWERILGGTWGDLAKSAAEDYKARDEIMRRSKPDVEREAIGEWLSSKYEFAFGEQAEGAITISFDRMYDMYLDERPVCKSVTRAFFARSVFYNTSHCPEMDESGTFSYSGLLLVSEIPAKVDSAYAKFRDAQDALDAISTPAAVEELLDEIASVDCDKLCFYHPTAYPNGRVTCRYWTRILEGCWGDEAAESAEAHARRDDLIRRDRVKVEFKALNAWVWSKYARDYDDLNGQSQPSDATDVPFEDLYEAYMATGSVCASVTRIFFAKSLFYNAGLAPDKSEEGIYSYRLRPIPTEPKPDGHVGEEAVEADGASRAAETVEDAKNVKLPKETHDPRLDERCFPYLTPYPNDEQQCQDWEYLLKGDEDGNDDGWGGRTRNLVEARMSIDARTVGAEMEAVWEWFSSNYEPTLDEHKSLELPFYTVHGEYLADERPVGKRATRAFFATSLFYAGGVLPVHIKGDFYYLVAR